MSLPTLNKKTKKNQSPLMQSRLGQLDENSALKQAEGNVVLSKTPQVQTEESRSP